MSDPPYSGPALLSYGFRPFFLCAGIYAVLAMMPWLLWLDPQGLGGDVLDSTSGFPILLWHGHALLFGYVAAVIAGFFLTALPNWTGAAPLRGAPLAGLVGLWLAGRLVSWFGAPLPAGLVAAVDVAFLVALAILVARCLWRAGKRRNLVLVGILCLLIAANLLIHLEVMGLTVDTGLAGLTLATNAVLLLIVIVGGRIVPSFTRNALARDQAPAPPRQQAMLDRLAILSVLLVLLTELAAPGSVALGAVAVLAAGLNAARMAGWRGLRTLKQPILWVLHLGYLWVVAGLAAKSVAGLTDWLAPTAALHAINIGAIGTFTLAVMSRAALGHTGRPLAVGPAIAGAYVLVSLAAVVRIVGPALAPDRYTPLMLLAGGLWALAFAIFVLVYWPILVRARAARPPA